MANPQLQRFAHDFLRGNLNGQYRAWGELANRIDDIYAQLGKLPAKFVDGVASQSPVEIPSAAQFAVAGVDGKFLIQIVNPENVVPQSPAIARAQIQAGLNLGGTPILHNLHSSLTLDFDNSSSFINYGISSQLAYSFQDPNVTRFFRLRSSFDGKTWNAWRVYSSPITCGPVGVWSGLQRSLADVILNVSSTQVGASVLAQSGLTTRINVAATQLVTGGQTIQYGSGFVDPGAFGTWYVYWIDLERQGGTPVFIATQNASDLTAQDGVVAAGAPITTAGGGGGTGGGGGGTGSCCTAGAQVDMADGSIKEVSELRRGMQTRNPFGQAEEITRIELVPGMPCFSADMQTGERLTGFSSSHGFRYASAGLVSGFNLLPNDVLAFREGAREVREKKFVGLKTVYRIELSGPTKLYIADGAQSHNFLKP